MPNEVKALIEQSIEKAKSLLGTKRDWVRTDPPTPLGKGIPTLAKDIYQPFTPQLKQRFEQLGRWEWSTHGHWLSLEDMQALWTDGAGDQLLQRIKGLRAGVEQGWPNVASALFRPERLSLFAASDLNYQTVYLLWLEFEDEPEIWVYDPNGESRYKDLAEYLAAYLHDDVTAAERRWKLAESERLGSKP